MEVADLFPFTMDGQSDDNDESVPTYDVIMDNKGDLKKEIVKILDKYQLHKSIYCNSRSLIWVGQIKETKIPIAVKFIETQKFTKARKLQSQQYKKCIREVRSSHFIELIQIIEEQKFDIIVTKRACKGNLYSYVLTITSFLTQMERKKRLKWVKQIILNIAEGLKDLHKQGYVFRDLKPENILIQHDGKPKICDFGLVSKIGTIDTSFCGTVQYMAPQRLIPSGQDIPISPSIDMYSLGILLYQLITGQPPFNQDDPDKIIDEMYQMNISFDESFPIKAKSLILSLLQFKPKNRLTIDELLNHQFFIQNDHHVGNSGVEKYQWLPRCQCDDKTLKQLKF